MLLLIPQRYEFSSKSQHKEIRDCLTECCCWYHKGTNFQANHNVIVVYVLLWLLLLIPQRYEFSSKSQQFIYRQLVSFSCCWYHKGTNFQANHNLVLSKQQKRQLLLIPQRYEFSSKSQQAVDKKIRPECCCWYHKGTNFQANHNRIRMTAITLLVVADTTKVRIFKQITTPAKDGSVDIVLLLIPQRYEFSSKSQHDNFTIQCSVSCCWYHKGTNFQANHN